MARTFHITYFDLFRTGNGVFYTDDSSIHGRNRKEYGTLEGALKPAKTCGRDDFEIIFHNFNEEREADARKRMRLYSKAKLLLE
jgi:hypothetical protein